jgi:GTP-binding protein HflX
MEPAKTVVSGQLPSTSLYSGKGFYAILEVMKKLHSTAPEPVRAFLVGIRTADESKTEAAALRQELAGLVDTLGLETAGAETVTLREPGPQYGMGSGKAAEIAGKAAAAGAVCIVFDREISPSQQRNWEKLSGLSAIDRQELIIRIFAGRARTREAALQAELARLLYALPRLSHKYVDLSRQRGGRYGTRGAGETRLETDRRLIKSRIDALREELAEMRRQRQVQRRQRERRGTPVAALVGYTNAGKSSLHRALTGSDVLVEDKLFATLDTTSRRVRLPGADGGERSLIIVDTVGFIRRLPHNLVDAFRSTLEEAAKADLLIHVADASDPSAEEHHATVLAVLEELGAGKIPRITVLNKIDLKSAEDLSLLWPESVPVSAKTGHGIDALWNLVSKTLSFDLSTPIIKQDCLETPLAAQTHAV